MRTSSPLRRPPLRRARPPARRLPRLAPRDRRDPPERGEGRGPQPSDDERPPWDELEAERAAAEPGRVPPGAGRATSARRVLIVDDERPIRFLCRVNLNSAGMETLEAEDGEEALRIAAAERPDLILLDVMMPGIDGWEVARELARRPETRHIPVVFLTARADQTDRERGHELGGVGYLAKPFDPIMLPARLEGLLRRLEQGEREQLNREVLTAEDDDPAPFG